MLRCQSKGSYLCSDQLVSLTNLAPLRSNAIEEAEVVDLAVAVFYVQLGEVKVDPVAARHTDLPLAHRVVWVCPRVTQRGQSPAAGAKHAGATAIACRTKQIFKLLLFVRHDVNLSVKCRVSMAGLSSVNKSKNNKWF